MSGEQPDDLDESFARIVAGYHQGRRDAGASPWPASEDIDDKAEPPDPSPPTSYAASEPPRAPADDEGHFVPPPLPPAPRPELATRLAWAGVLGTPLVFVLLAVTGWLLPRLLTGILVFGFVAGIVWLIATNSAKPTADSDPDDGAVV